MNGIQTWVVILISFDVGVIVGALLFRWHRDRWLRENWIPDRFYRREK